MEPSCMEIESGLQLFARLSSTPSLQGLDYLLFPHGPRHKEIIEISGNLSSGKTLLLTQLFVKCLLPKVYQDLCINGLGAGALFINTDHDFRPLVLADLMNSHIKNTCASNGMESPKQEVLDAIVRISLDNLTIVNCFDSDHLRLTLQSFDTYLSSDKRIALVVIDSLTSYYWQDRQNRGIWSMNLYVKNMLQVIQQHTFEFKVVTIYTRPSDFASEGWETMDCVAEPTLDKINYRIQLHKQEMLNEFTAIVESAESKKKMDYSIGTSGIKWIKNEL